MNYPFTIRHSLPTRTRIRWGGEDRERATVVELAPRIESLQGVETAEARPQTGSIVIYHPDVDGQTLQARMASELAIEIIDPPVRTAPTGLEFFNRNVDRLDASFKKIDLDTGSVSFLSLLLLSLLQAARGQWGPSAFSFLWYALNYAARNRQAPVTEASDPPRSGPAGIRPT